MKNHFRLMAFLAILFLGSCNSSTPKQEDQKAQKDSSNEGIDDTPRVTGIGGIFFISENPEAAKAWYEDHLGLAMDEYGAVFEFRNANRPEETNYLRWSVSSPNAYFEPSDKGFMINYRVQHIEALLDSLKKEGVTVLDSIAEYPYGKFVHILDPENNKIELWEPVDSVLTTLGGKTTK